MGPVICTGQVNPDTAQGGSSRLKPLQACSVLLRIGSASKPEKEIRRLRIGIMMLLYLQPYNVQPPTFAG
jgi:hypothetical protein